MKIETWKNRKKDRKGKIEEMKTKQQNKSPLRDFVMVLFSSSSFLFLLSFLSPSSTVHRYQIQHDKI